MWDSPRTWFLGARRTEGCFVFGCKKIIAKDDFLHRELREQAILLCSRSDHTMNGVVFVKLLDIKNKKALGCAHQGQGFINISDGRTEAQDSFQVDASRGIRAYCQN